MRLLRASHLPALVAWLVIGSVVGWLATHPRLVAPYAASLVSRHLLRIEQGGLRVTDFRVRQFEGLDLYGVSLTLPGDRGGLTLVSADTVRVDFQLGEVLGAPPRVRRLTVTRPEVYTRANKPADGDQPAAGLRSTFPQLIVDHLDVRDARLDVSDSGGRLQERVSDLQFQGSLEARDDLHLVLRRLDAHWETRSTVINDLRGEVRVDTAGIHVANLFGGLNAGRVEAAGFKGWDRRLDLTVSATDVVTSEVEDLLDMGLGFVARGDLDGHFAAPGDSVVFRGEFSGELEGYHMRQVYGRVAAGPATVLLEHMDGRVNGARFRGNGWIDLDEAAPVNLRLEGDVEDVDLASGLVPGEEELPPSDGHGRLVIEHGEAPLWTRVTGGLRDGFVSVLPFDSCRVDVFATEDSVVFHRADFHYADLQVQLRGFSDADKIFRGDVEASSTDLSSLPASWEWPALRGQAEGSGRVEGPLDDLRFQGSAILRGAVLANLDTRRLNAHLDVADVLGDPVFDVDARGRGLAVGDVPLGDFRLAGTASSRGAEVEEFRAVYGDTVLAARLRAAFGDSLHTFNLDLLSCSLEGTAWALVEPTSFEVGRGRFFLPATTLASERGSLKVDAYYERDAVVTGELELDNFDLALLDPFVGTEEPLSGTVTARAAVGGVPSDPVVELQARLLDSPFALARVDTLEVAAGFSQGVVDFRDLVLVTEFGRIRGGGAVAHGEARRVEDFWPGAELDMQLVIDRGDWAFLEQFELPALDRLAGQFTGDLAVAGTTDSPLVRGNLHGAPFHIHWLHLDELTGEVWADADALVLGNLAGRQDDLALTGRIEVPMDLDFLSEPLTPLDGPFYMQLEIPDDSNLEPLSRATNAFVRTSGRGGASVVVSGPLEHPLYQGRLKIRDTGFVLRNMEEIYAGASCEGVFRGDELVVSNISGREGLRGTFTGDGRVVFDGLDLRTFDVYLDLDRFLVASLPELRVVVNSRRARLSGHKVGPDSLLVPKFSGSYDVVKARYTGRFNEQGSGPDPLAATVAPDWLADLEIHGEPRTAHIINRDMELDLGGDLNLVRDEEGLYLRGTLDVNAGRFIVFNNSFRVTRGVLDFSRELAFDPQVDVDAETKYRLRSQYSSNSIIENIGVHVGGQLSRPEITFSSERGYSRAAIQRMLLGLEPHATPEGDDAEALQATGISAGFNVLEREIARELAVFDTFEIDQIQRQRSTGDQGIDPLIGVGKYIGSDLYLKYAQGVRQDDRDFIVEYQINRHLLLQSEVRRRIDENQGQPTYNLDFKYRFEY
ncbi:MAG: hypothetical protein GY838_18095 [bacterium]|nr:hypothetical protein [bacterium]